MRWRGRGRGRLGRALVGAQQHLVLDGALCAAALLLHQELLEAARGEGERLSPQLHQVRVLQPGLREAIPRGRTSPEAKQIKKINIINVPILFYVFLRTVFLSSQKHCTRKKRFKG